MVKMRFKDAKVDNFLAGLERFIELNGIRTKATALELLDLFHGHLDLHTNNIAMYNFGTAECFIWVHAFDHSS